LLGFLINWNLFGACDLVLGISWCYAQGPLDLHTLGTPPAFVLSQDQTLKEILSTF